MALIETLTDNFDDNSFDSGTWFRTDSVHVLEQNQRIEVTTILGGAYYEVSSISTFDARDSYAQTELVNAGDQSLASLEVYPIVVAKDANNSVFILVTNNLVQAYKNVAGSSTLVLSRAYDSNEDKFFKIRERAGTVIFYTSKSGLHNEWKYLASTATPFDMSACTIQNLTGTYAVELAVTTAMYDNVNVVGNNKSVANGFRRNTRPRGYAPGIAK